MVVRSAVRWGATHGAMRLAIRARARAGNPDAEILLDPAVREDPYEHYERLRTSAPFAGGAFARVSVHHDVCTDVLRSDAFGQIGGNRTDGLPPVLKVALRLAGPRPSVGPIDPPSMLAVDPPDHTRYRRLVSRAFSARAVAGCASAPGRSPANCWTNSRATPPPAGRSTSSAATPACCRSPSSPRCSASPWRCASSSSPGATAPRRVSTSGWTGGPTAAWSATSRNSTPGSVATCRTCAGHPATTCSPRSSPRPTRTASGSPTGRCWPPARWSSARGSRPRST